MKKLLILILTTSYGLQGITPAPTFDIHATESISLEQIEPVTVPLGPESQSWVNQWSIAGAVAGASLGAAAYLCLPSHIKSSTHQNSDITDKIYTAATSIAGVLVGYFGTNFCAISYTPEKVEESKANSLISDYNIAVKAFQLVNLNSQQRTVLNQLPFNNPEKDQSRLKVYESISIPSSTNPILDRVQYVKDLTDRADQEAKAYAILTASRIEQLRRSSLIKNAADIAKTIDSHKKYIATMNLLIPKQSMKHWYTHVEKHAPEHTAESMHKKAILLNKQILTDEKEIKLELARLAALYGYVFSQADLSSSIWSFVLLDIVTNYPDTAEGRKARKEDIKITKNRISRLMQNYQNKIIDYNNAALEHSELNRYLDDSITDFILTHGGTTKGLKGLNPNRRLLEYNNYLNHSNGNVFWNWVQSCFEN